MKKYTLALDLVDDEQLIAEYEQYHKKIWTEIRDSITTSGIQDMEIYRIGNRLFMSIETEDNFSFDTKAKLDIENPKVQAWESLMWKYQQALPMAKNGEKWLLMTKIFDLKLQ